MVIAIGASSGGHMNELLCLLESEEGKKIKPSIIVTTKEIVRDSLVSITTHIYVLGECNRHDFWRIPLVAIKAFFAVHSDKPDVVISTGALPVAIYAYFAKKRGAKVIWIDSIANIDKLSLSGRWALKFADRIYTQWQDLSGGRVMYKGNLI